MAKTLSNSGISTTQTIEAGHVTQSINAFTGTEAYDITLSGSLSLPGTIASGSFQGDGSGLTGVVSASFASTASFLEGSVTSASYASTASYIQADNIDQPFTNITASGNISASGGLYIGAIYLNGNISYNALSSNNNELQIGAGTPWTSYTFGRPAQTEPMLFNANITASGNISASGDVYGVTGSFSHLVGNSPITVTSPVISQLNGTKLIEVENSSSFPTPVGTQITLEENTTYLIRGNVNMSDTLYASGSGISLIGLDRNLDTLTYTSSSTFITVENSDFTIRDLKFSATNTSSLLISGSDYTSGSFNQGRDKIFEIVNAQFRNCGNVVDFKGYDLVDISNTLFFYVQAPTIGVRFTDTSKTEISSCEFIRWYDETSNPTPSGYSTAPMIEFADTGSEGVGFGAVNVNGCIIHPQVQQDGIRIATGSTTGFGTISSNAFININLTTGSLFYPTTASLPDYSLTSTKKYDVFANQGIANSTAYLLTDMVSNSTDTVINDIGVYEEINTGGNNVVANSQRWSGSAGGIFTYQGTKDIYSSFTFNIAFEKVGGGNDDYEYVIYKNNSMISSSATIRNADRAETFTMVYSDTVSMDDFYQIYVRNNDDTANITINGWHMLIKE